MTVFEKNNRQWNQIAYFLINNPQYTLAEVIKNEDAYNYLVHWLFKNPTPDNFRMF